MTSTLSAILRWLSRSGICAVAGSIGGSIAGLVFGLVLLAVPAHTIAFREALPIGAFLGVVAWLAVLFLLLVFGRYSPRAVVGQSFVTCMLASILTALAVN